MGPDWLQPTLDWLNANPTWAGVIIFAVSLAESLLVVGVLVPGALLMLAFGALIALGTIDLWSTLLWAIAGAIVGDGISFWIGYHFKDSLRTVWPFNKHPQMLKRGEHFFMRHGGKSVVLGRFVGPVRAVIPTVAGIMGMSPRRFTVINVLSAIAWAPTYILPGVAVGASLGLASQVATRFGLLVFGFIILLLLVAWLIKRLFRTLQPRAQYILKHAIHWAYQHPVLGRFVMPIIDAKQPETISLLFFAGLLFVSSWLFTALFLNAYVSPLLISIDETVYSLFQNLRNTRMDHIMIGISQLGDAYVTLPITVIIALYLALQQQPKTAIYWLAALTFAFVSTFLLKGLLGIPRPSPIYDGLSMFSFPSGHAVVNMVMYGFLAVIAAHKLPSYHRWLPYTLAGIIIVMIAISRVYLGAHWFSDVIGGLTLGILWVTLLGISYQRHRPPIEHLGRFTTLLVLGLLLTFTFHFTINHEQEVQRYTHETPRQTITNTTWWAGGWRTLPAYRIDIIKQHSHQPLTLQWAGNVDKIKETLIEQGWTVSDGFSLASSLLWLSPDAKLDDMPLLPKAHNGQHEHLVMKKYLADTSRLFAIRLWPSQYRLSSGENIALGYITELTMAHTSWFSYLNQLNDYNTPLSMLPEQLPGWQIQSAQRKNGHPVRIIRPDQP